MPAVVSAAHLAPPPPAEGSAKAGVRTNAETDGPVRLSGDADERGRALLAQASATMRPSARGYHRVLCVARTIADLAGAETIGRVHVAEALSYHQHAPVN